MTRSICINFDGVLSLNMLIKRLCYAYKKTVLFHFLGLLLVFDSILFRLFVSNLILFCLFVDAFQKESLQGFECKRPLCSAVEQTLMLNVDILR